MKVQSATKAVMAACLMCVSMAASAQTDPQWTKAYNAYMDNTRNEDPMTLGFVSEIVEKLKPENPHMSEKQWAEYKKSVIKEASKALFVEGGKLEMKYRELFSGMTAKELTELNAITQKPVFKKLQEVMLKGKVAETVMEEFGKSLRTTAEIMEKKGASYGLKF